MKGTKALKAPTRNEAEALLGKYAATKSREAALNGEMDQELNAVREKYQNELTQLDTEITGMHTRLELFATANRKHFEGKSMAMTHGRLLFKNSKPSLSLLPGFDWDRVTKLISSRLPAYLRVKNEPAKDKLLADRELPEVSKMLKRVGIQVTSGESFYVETK